MKSPPQPIDRFVDGGNEVAVFESLLSGVNLQGGVAGLLGQLVESEGRGVHGPEFFTTAEEAQR